MCVERPNEKQPNIFIVNSYSYLWLISDRVKIRLNKYKLFACSTNQRLYNNRDYSGFTIDDYTMDNIITMRYLL